MSAVAINPERFGRYVLLDRIGEGGMAEVFRAIMPGAEGFKRTLVVKRILAPHNESAEFVDMFIREARIGSMLSHPNIVQVYDFGSVEGHYFLAMEYLRGRDVLAIIRRLRDTKTAFPIPVAAFIAHEVAACLAYAHALAGPDGRSFDLIHRDVSPSNVMCLREGGVKLLDFGIAKAVGEFPQENTGQGNFKGKLAYMAPERMRNEPIDGRSDLYALGVVLWEMLTCRRLFRGASEVDTFKNILNMTVPPPSSLRDDVPPALDAIVMRAIERDPAKRYASGQAMADDLEEFLRETKFKARMLPKLLVDLFGAGLQSHQVALSQLTPELLAAGTSSEGFEVESRSSSSFVAPRTRWKSWRLLVMVGVAAAVAMLGVYVTGRRSRPPNLGPANALPEAVRAVSPAAMSIPPPPPVASAPPEAQAGVSEHGGVGEAAKPSDTPARSQGMVNPTTRKAKRHVGNRRTDEWRGVGEDGAIGSGRSIDPFKEAATRGH